MWGLRKDIEVVLELEGEGGVKFPLLVESMQMGGWLESEG